MRYEFKKLIHYKIIPIGFAAAFLCGVLYSGYFMLNRLDYSGIAPEEMKRLSACTGRYTEEKRLLSEQLYLEKAEAFGDKEPREDMDDFLVMMKYNDVYNRAEICREAIEYRRNLTANAARLKQSEEGYYAKLNAKVEKMYSAELDLKIREGDALELMTTICSVSEPVDMVFLLVLVILSGSVFVTEHRSGTYRMVYSSFRGRRSVYIRKILLVLAAAWLLSVLQTAAILSFSFTRGSLCLFDPVQEAKMFLHSPYRLNVLGLIAAVTILRGIAYTALSSIFLFVSQFFTNSIPPLAVNSLIGLGGFGMTHFCSGRFLAPSGSVIPQAGFYQYLREFSPYVLIDHGEEYLTKYESVNLFGHPAALVSITAAVNLAAALLFLLAGYAVYKRWFRKKGV